MVGKRVPPSIRELAEYALRNNPNARQVAAEFGTMSKTTAARIARKAGISLPAGQRSSRLVDAAHFREGANAETWGLLHRAFPDLWSITTAELAKRIYLWQCKEAAKGHAGRRVRTAVSIGSMDSRIRKILANRPAGPSAAQMWDAYLAHLRELPPLPQLARGEPPEF